MPKKKRSIRPKTSSTSSGRRTRSSTRPSLSSTRPPLSKRRVKKKPAGVSTLSDSELEEQFLLFLKAEGLLPTQQYTFHPTRAWRFDFSWPAHKLAIEVQGFGPGHNSYAGMSSDYEKHNAATLLGWRILYFMAHDLNPYKKGNTIAIITNALQKT